MRGIGAKLVKRKLVWLAQCDTKLKGCGDCEFDVDSGWKLGMSRCSVIV